MNRQPQPKPRPRYALRAGAFFGALACLAAPAFAAPDVGVSVHVSQPGVYGRVDIGNVPRPTLVYAQPILVQPPPPPRAIVVAPAPPQPIYMWVPPGHQKNWGKHCARYGACGVPVYFVRDRWYREHVHVARHAPPVVYARPGHVARHDDVEREHGHGHGHGKDKDKGHGKDKDKGHGKGHGDRD